MKPGRTTFRERASSRWGLKARSRTMVHELRRGPPPSSTPPPGWNRRHDAQQVAAPPGMMPTMVPHRPLLTSISCSSSVFNACCQLLFFRAGTSWHGGTFAAGRGGSSTPVEGAGRVATHYVQHDHRVAPFILLQGGPAPRVICLLGRYFWALSARIQRPVCVRVRAMRVRSMGFESGRGRLV